MRFGVHYEYPFGGMAERKEWLPRGPDDWRRDLAAIRDTGFDLIRIRIGQDSDLGEVAQLLDLAHQHELDVMFGFATFYVPWWFVEQHPDARVVDRDGNALADGPLDFRWPRVCIHHPAYRASRDELVDACAARFMRHPAVVAWDVHNEPCVAHGGYPCYCGHTLAAYRDAVAEELGSIAAFNELTGSSFTDFGAIEPPRSVEEGERAWRHWREFMTAALSEFLLSARELVKRHDADALVTYNVDPVSEWNVQQMVLDRWTSRELDLLSKSHYAGSDDATASAGVSIAALKALAGEKELWITECQAGPGRAMPELISRSWTGREIELEMNCMVGHGIRGLVLYRWEPLVDGPETGSIGLTEAGEYDTERRLSTKRAIARLRAFEPILDRGRSRPARVGVYLRQHQLHGAEERRAPADLWRGPLYDGARGQYAVWTELGYETGVVVDDPDPAATYELISFPWMYEPGDVDAVRAVVAAGKRAVVELPGRDRDRALEVAAALGLAADDTEYPGLHDPTGGWNLRPAQDAAGAVVGYAYDNRVVLRDAGGQRALLRFGGDGAPAAVLPDGYEERLLVLAFPLGQSYARSHHWALRQTIGAYVGGFLAPDVRVTGVPREASPLVETRVLESDAGALALVVNRSHDTLDLGVAVDGYEDERTVVAGHAVAHLPLRRRAS